MRECIIACGRQAVAQPLRLHLLEPLDHSGHAGQGQAVGCHGRSDMGLLKCIEDAKHAYAQAVFTLRPTAIVGIEAAELAHQAWVTQAARRGLKVPVFEMQHHEQVQTRRKAAGTALRQGTVAVVRVVHVDGSIVGASTACLKSD